MQLKWFHYFLETSRQKSLTKASEKLNITQPALSKLIRNLESELDVTLFDRTVTGMELTAAGAQLQERIGPILDEMNALFSDLRSLNGFSQLKIGVLPSIATYYIPTRMSFINEALPNTQLVVRNTSDEVLQYLTSGEVQLVIAESQKSVLKHFWQSPLFEEPYYCIVPESSHLSHNDSIRVSDIAEQPLVVYPANCDIRDAIVRNYRRHDVTPNISLEIPFSESILAFVSAGAGITIAPKMIADQARRYGLRAVHIVDFEETRQVSIIARSETLGKLLRKCLLKP